MKKVIDMSKYQCTICQLIFQEPIKLKECNHCFCKECLTNCIKVQDNNSDKKTKYQ